MVVKMADENEETGNEMDEPAPAGDREETARSESQEVKQEEPSVETRSEREAGSEQLESFEETAQEVQEVEQKPQQIKLVGRLESRTKVAKRSQDSEAFRRSQDVNFRNAKDALTNQAKMVVGDVIDIRRASLVGDVCDRKPAKYMNSYVMNSDNPFNPEKVIKILRTVMEEAVAHLTYEPHACVKKAKLASSTIRHKLRQLNFTRYKLVSVVTIGEKHSQDIFTTCRFLWDAEKDRYMSYAVENSNVYCIALCFGMYYE